MTVRRYNGAEAEVLVLARQRARTGGGSAMLETVQVASELRYTSTTVSTVLAGLARQEGSGFRQLKPGHYEYRLDADTSPVATGARAAPNRRLRLEILQFLQRNEGTAFGTAEVAAAASGRQGSVATGLKALSDTPGSGVTRLGRGIYVYSRPGNEAAALPRAPEPRPREPRAPREPRGRQRGAPAEQLLEVGDQLTIMGFGAGGRAIATNDGRQLFEVNPL